MPKQFETTNLIIQASINELHHQFRRSLAKKHANIKVQCITSRDWKKIVEETYGQSRQANQASAKLIACDNEPEEKFAIKLQSSPVYNCNATTSSSPLKSVFPRYSSNRKQCQEWAAQNSCEKLGFLQIEKENLEINHKREMLFKRREREANIIHTFKEYQDNRSGKRNNPKMIESIVHSIEGKCPEPKKIQHGFKTNRLAFHVIDPNRPKKNTEIQYIRSEAVTEPQRFSRPSTPLREGRQSIMKFKSELPIYFELNCEHGVKIVECSDGEGKIDNQLKKLEIMSRNARSNPRRQHMKTAVQHTRNDSDIC